MVTTTKASVMSLILPPEKLRPLLMLTRREPLSVAVGITTDDEPVMLLHKTAKPKKVMAQLRADAAKAKASLNTAVARFGVAHVDEDEDSGLLQITINKEAPDKLRLRLTQLVKPFALRAVVFTVDPALEQEPEDAGPGGPELAAPLNPGVILADLRALVGRLNAGGPNPAAQALAMRAGEGLKSGRHGDAAVAIGLLRAALDGAAGAAGGQAAPAAAAPRVEAYEKAQRLWAASFKAAEAELATLTAAIKDAYAPEGLGDVVSGAFTAAVRPEVERTDRTLAPAIQALLDAPAADRARALVQARGVVAGLQKDFAAAPAMAALDGNPFGTGGIARPISAALAAIGRSLV